MRLRVSIELINGKEKGSSSQLLILSIGVSAAERFPSAEPPPVTVHHSGSMAYSK